MLVNINLIYSVLLEGLNSILLQNYVLILNFFYNLDCNFGSLKEVTISNFCWCTLSRFPVITIASWRDLFLLVSFLFHPNALGGIPG